jgi:serine/threonine protein kinase
LKAPETLLENVNKYYLEIELEHVVIDPEKHTIRIEQRDFDIYSFLSDIYSYGMVLYEMFSKKIPFEGLSEEEVNN